MIRVDQDSSVGIATSYGLDGPGIEFRSGRDFPHPYRPVLGSTQHQVFFPRVKRPGRGVTHRPAFSAEVKEGVELNIYYRSGPSGPVLERTLPFILKDGHHTDTD
jgi:hypothetical protein